MNEDNKRENIREEIDREKEAIRAANFYSRTDLSEMPFENSIIPSSTVLELCFWRRDLNPKAMKAHSDYLASISLSLDPSNRKTPTYSPS